MLCCVLNSFFFHYWQCYVVATVIYYCDFYVVVYRKETRLSYEKSYKKKVYITFFLGFNTAAVAGIDVFPIAHTSQWNFNRAVAAVEIFPVTYCSKINSNRIVGYSIFFFPFSSSLFLTNDIFFYCLE